MIIHGESKVGKTWLGDTAPAPRLVLDAEGGVDWTESRKVEWDPVNEKPPINDGTWDTCVVRVINYQTFEYARQWLASGMHPFHSVIMDSVSEVQQRCVDSMVGINPMKTQDWGELLRKMSSAVREFRDFTLHPTNPLTAVVLIAMSRLNPQGKYIPYVQGQLATTLPYYFDVIGYLFIQDTEDGTKMRRLLVSPHPMYEAGERLGGRLGEVVDNPNIVSMMDMVYGLESHNTPNGESLEQHVMERPDVDGGEGGA